MFIIDVHYIVPFEKLDEHRAAHIKHMDKYYKRNVFVASGRKMPQTGGVILARADSVEDIEKIITEDPFHTYKLAEFKITQFLTSKCQPGFKNLLDI